jgi:hypothetical protein
LREKKFKLAENKRIEKPKTKMKKKLINLEDPFKNKKKSILYPKQCCFKKNYRKILNEMTHFEQNGIVSLRTRKKSHGTKRYCFGV